LLEANELLDKMDETDEEAVKKMKARHRN